MYVVHWLGRVTEVVTLVELSTKNQNRYCQEEKEYILVLDETFPEAFDELFVAVVDSTSTNGGYASRSSNVCCDITYSADTTCKPQPEERYR